MKNLKSISVLFVIVSFLLSCSNIKQISRYNWSLNYNYNYSIQSPKFVLYNEENNSNLIYSIDPNIFVYKKDLNDGYNKAKFTISYKIFNDFETTKIIDSCSYFFTDSLYYLSNKKIKGTINIKNINKDGVILISVKDNNNNSVCNSIIENVKSLKNSFLIYDNENNIVLGDNFKVNQYYKIKSSLRYNNLIVKYYNNDSCSLALPPFAKENNKDKETFEAIYEIKMLNDTINFIAQKKGVYCFYNDTINLFNLNCFADNYYGFDNISSMLKPLQYITTNDEYWELENKDSVKQNIEKFWSKIGGDIERTNILVKKFYNRVEEANMYFTTYKEGWKTDRGMLFLILGTPDIVYKSSETEVWLYLEDRETQALRFTFVKTKNKINFTEYNLIRLPIFKGIWFMSVDKLRKGQFIE